MINAFSDLELAKKRSAEAHNRARAREEKEAEQGGLKHDDGKRPWHLIPWDAASALAGIDLAELVDDTPTKGELVLVAIESLKGWFQSPGGPARLDVALWCVLAVLETEIRGGDPEAEYVDSTAYYLLGLSRVADVLQFGARKYGARNWEKGIAYSRCFSATIRHIFASYIEDERDDPEAGISHMAHAACEILFLMTFETRGLAAFDDRPRAAK